MSFEVDLDELRATVESLTSLEATVEQRLGRLEEVMRSLQATWSGEAAAAQRSTHDRWVAGAREMHEALGRMRAAAQHAHDGYSAAVEANGSMWRQTR